MFGWIKKQAARIWNSGLANPARWFVDSVSGGKSDSGIAVNDRTALSYPPVWYAVCRIAGHVGQLPLLVHRRLDRGAEKANSHAAYRLLKTRPNPYQTAIQFKETLMVHALLWGNGKAAIVRRNNQPAELLLIPPNRSVTCYVEGEKWHVLDLDEDDRIVRVGGTRSGVSEGAQYKIPDRDVIHIPGLGLSGIGGLEIFEIGKNAIGLGLGSEKAASKHFGNGARPDIVLEAPPGVLRDDADAQDLINNWNSYHRGLDNKGKVGLLREGIKATAMGMSAEESQWIEQRKFQRQEVALLFLLESILGDDTSVSYNSLEQKNLAYLSNCLMRWLIKIEQECDEKLLSQSEKARDSHFWKFNTAALLRSDFKTTIESLSAAISARIMSPNEAREKLDMNPYDGGDEYENPAITPGPSGGGSDDSMTVDPEDASRAAIAAHLRHLIGVESKKVLAAAGNKGNYLSWVEKFYSGWSPKLAKSIEALGGNQAIAEGHCERSRAELLDLSGTVTPDGLADAVAELVEQWPKRAEELTDTILTEGLAHVV